MVLLLAPFLKYRGPSELNTATAVIFHPCSERAFPFHLFWASRRDYRPPVNTTRPRPPPSCHWSLTQQGKCEAFPVQVSGCGGSSQPRCLAAGRFQQDLLQLQDLDPTKQLLPGPPGWGEKGVRDAIAQIRNQGSDT